jgi:excisionase family DNA binding protein
MEIEQRWYTTAEVADLLRVHPRTIQRAILDGELRGIKLSNRAGWRISEADLQAWLAGRANKPPASQ